MTTTEKLQRIRARCVELLSIAEKRTPGKWEIKQTSCGVEVCTNSRKTWVADSDEVIGKNATFIASCAGSAEAGWRSTIAAIDAYEKLSWFTAMEKMINAIIAVWPEELL